MKEIMIKIVVILLGISLYFNVSQFYTNQSLETKNDQLNEVIDSLDDISPDDQCQKVYEITIQVIVEKDDINQTVVHCTNQVTLGDALDELIDEMEVVYDPNFSKDYIYGRLVHSFYGVSKVFEEYYEISIENDRADFGVDYIELSDDTTYTFTLVRWS